MAAQSLNQSTGSVHNDQLQPDVSIPAPASYSANDGFKSLVKVTDLAGQRKTSQDQ
jgi:hypothetical protein